MAFTEFKKKYNKKLTKPFRATEACVQYTIPKYWRKVFSRDRESDLVVTEQESVQPFSNLPPTCRQARLFYVSKQIFPNTSTSEARLINVGFTDQTIAAFYVCSIQSHEK